MNPDLRVPGNPDLLDRSGRGRFHAVPAIVGDVLVFALVAVDIARTLRHAMWRDELQIFMLAAGSPSLASLFEKLKYEAHPGLWHTLVWLLTRVTSDPMWMQVLHVVLAAAAWCIVWRWSPFDRWQKILLLLSYFLFFEYFVISRSYVLLALIGFAYAALRLHRPASTFVPWLLLGLLANVHLLGAIWSIALAATFLLHAMLHGVPRARVYWMGAVVYLLLLAFAIATMIPAPDYGPWGHDVGFAWSRLDSELGVPFGAFVPFDLATVRENFAFLTQQARAPVPEFWNINLAPDVIAAFHADTDHPFELAVAFLLPVLACWLVTRKAMPLLQFSLAYVGILLFTTIWAFPGYARHHGVVFLAFVAATWMARAQRAPAVSSSVALGVVLGINAFGGLLTLASELRPFSESRDAAAWIRQNTLADAVLIGSRDAQVSAVAGYLERPVYYLECRCRGTFIVWNDKRQSELSGAQFTRRLVRAVEMADGHDAILIRNRPLAPDEPALKEAGLSATPLKAFANASTDENYWLYRMRRNR